MIINLPAFRLTVLVYHVDHIHEFLFDGVLSETTHHHAELLAVDEPAVGFVV